MTKHEFPADGSAATRFVKGRSGNPNGRPRHPKMTVASPFAILDEKLTVNMPVEKGELSLEAAMLIKTYQRAVTGNSRAQKKLVKMILEREAIRLDGRAPGQPKVVWRQEETEPENAFEAIEIFGIGSRVTQRVGIERPGPLALARWAVEAALKRLKPGDLAEHDPELIAQSTHDGLYILWPRGLRDRG